MIDCPGAHTLDDQRVREAAVFLHHKAGHRVPVAVQVIPIRDASSRVIGAAEVFQDNSTCFADREIIGRLQKDALIDHLTGLPNRRYLEMKLQTCLDDLKRYRFPFGIIFVDIDYFKGINDTIGHPMGDEVLRMVSHTLEANIRSSDLSGRWGGEEFVIVIQHLREEYLAAVANKLRALVEESPEREAGEQLESA
jgi:diguanylate cyclase (GGDEF)-like protein